MAIVSIMCIGTKRWIKLRVLYLGVWFHFLERLLFLKICFDWMKNLSVSNKPDKFIFCRNMRDVKLTHTTLKFNILKVFQFFFVMKATINNYVLENNNIISIVKFGITKKGKWEHHVNIWYTTTGILRKKIICLKVNLYQQPNHNYNDKRIVCTLLALHCTSYYVQCMYFKKITYFVIAMIAIKPSLYKSYPKHIATSCFIIYDIKRNMRILRDEHMR